MVELDEIREEYRKIFMEEGRYEAFEHCGLKCRMFRGPMGNRLGYVGVDNNHPKYCAEYVDTGVDVHGGLTYASKHLYMQPEKDIRWFGFDTSHSGDLILKKGMECMDFNSTYKDKEYVMSEVKSLALQLSTME